MGLFAAAAAHGLFDWMLMIQEHVSIGLGSIIYIAFLVGDIFLWKLGVKYIRKQQENSRLQAEEAAINDIDRQIDANTNYDSEYKRIDWNAGNRQSF